MALRWAARLPLAAVRPPVRLLPTSAASESYSTKAGQASKRKTGKKIPKCDQPANQSAAKALPKLLLRQLRQVALLCGRNTSGTKTVLSADLQQAMDQLGHRPANPANPLPERRVLSIDMGVRNLAYCLLHVSRPDTVPKLLAWERLSLIGDAAVEETGETEEPEKQAPAADSSPYSPPAMATVAARLVYERLLPLAPTHILIERQRFRSGGAAAVLEWTVRVNSLEAILHGILAAQKLLDHDSGTPPRSIEAVSPRRVSQFVVQGGLPTGVPLPPRTTKEKDIKDVKEAVVAALLRPAARQPRRLLAYDAGGPVGDMAAAFLTRWDAKQTRSRKKKDTGNKLRLTKIDDLADCVAQGLVWVEWEANLRALATNGAEALLAAKPLSE